MRPEDFAAQTPKHNENLSFYVLIEQASREAMDRWKSRQQESQASGTEDLAETRAFIHSMESSESDTYGVLLDDGEVAESYGNSEIPEKRALGKLLEAEEYLKSLEEILKKLETWDSDKRTQSDFEKEHPNLNRELEDLVGLTTTDKIELALFPEKKEKYERIRDILIERLKDVIYKIGLHVPQTAAEAKSMKGSLLSEENFTKLAKAYAKGNIS